MSVEDRRVAVEGQQVSGVKDLPQARDDLATDDAHLGSRGLGDQLLEPAATRLALRPEEDHDFPARLPHGGVDRLSKGDAASTG